MSKLGRLLRVESPLEDVEPARRRRIMRSVRDGEAVVDPRDAPIAVDAAVHMQRLLERRRLSWWPLVLLTTGFVAIALLDGDMTLGEAARLAMVVGGFAAVHYGVSLLSRRAARRAGQAEARNRAIMNGPDVR